MYLAVRSQLSEPWHEIMHALALNMGLDDVGRPKSTQTGCMWLNRARPCASRTRVAWVVKDLVVAPRHLHVCGPRTCRVNGMNCNHMRKTIGRVRVAAQR